MNQKDRESTPVIECTVTVLGIGGVGKSCLTVRFICNKFLEDYDPTIGISPIFLLLPDSVCCVEDSYVQVLALDGESVRLNVLDAAGQDDYDGIQQSWMRSGDGCVLVFSITSQASFKQISKIHQQVLRSKGGHEVLLVLVGNKCDLEEKRVVSRREAEVLAHQLRCKYIEASAKSSIRVKDVFIECVKEIRRTNRKRDYDTTAKGVVACCSILQINHRLFSQRNIRWKTQSSILGYIQKKKMVMDSNTLETFESCREVIFFHLLFFFVIFLLDFHCVQLALKFDVILISNLSHQRFNLIFRSGHGSG